MDSDSSLDGEFETKHEIAVKLRRNSTTDRFEAADEYESDEGTDHSSVKSSEIQSPPPEERGELSPQSNDGELSDSPNEDVQSNASSEYSKRSDVDVPLSIPEEEHTDKTIESFESKQDNSPSDGVGEILQTQTVKRNEITGHGEDLSDVSDLDSNDEQGSLDAVSDDDRTKEDQNDSVVNHGKRKDSDPVEEMEQLDFEAEEQQDKEEKEEGECEGKDEKSDDDGELKGDDLEEGELTDEDENRPEETEPRPVCRFYNRGQCTWGSSCRFVHPGVTDKGNYTMFDMVRPLVPVNGPPAYPPMDYRIPYEKPVVGMPYQAPRKEEPAVFESAWERGLRQAKEMMRKSSKRKETDMDFEEKKMNLSLGQEELDKENDYYTRPASPVYKEEERWGMKIDSDRYRDEAVSLERYEDMPESPYYHNSRGTGSDYWRRVHYEAGDSRAIRVEAEYSSGRERSSNKYHVQHQQHRQQPQEFYEKYEKKANRQKTHPTREVIVERVEKSWRDESRYTETSLPNRRGDEWADPWMRSKSPVGRKSGGRPSRHQSYSSGSSYSSSSSSRSSSQSSYSSYSHGSRSRSQSKSRSISRSVSRSSSRTPLSHGRRKPNRPLVPTARAAESSPPQLLAMSPRKSSKQLGEPRGFGKRDAAKATRGIAVLPTLSGPRRGWQLRKASKEVRGQQTAENTASPRNSSKIDVNLPQFLVEANDKPLTSSLIQSEKKAASERALLMNPPAPSPRKPKDVRPPSPGMMRKSAQNPPPPPPPPPPPLPPLASSRRSKSSRSSSGSDSSGSSSDSSESSCSSSSSSREPSPKVVCPPKRSMMDERGRLALAAETLKVKAMDALKLSGQKQQIKLTLKNTGANSQNKTKTTTGLPELPELNFVRRDRALPTLVGKKRPAENPICNDSAIVAKMAALAKPTQKKATSRREELLKQLKAVEDAIARKRSKI